MSGKRDVLSSYEEGGLWLMDNPIEMVEHLQSDERVINSLEMALESLCGDYKDLKLDSFGGQGLIYSCISNKYNTKLCIKIPFYNRLERDDAKEKAILKEALILQKYLTFDMESVPKLYNYSEKGKYILREYIEGETLYNFLNNIEYDKRVELLELEDNLVNKLLKTFDRAWNGEYLMSDIKAKNIIISKKQNKLIFIDFGNCKEISSINRLRQKKTINKVGSRRFLHWPPELLFGISELCSYKTDYFAFGVMAYYTLFLDYPYSNQVDGNYETVFEIYIKEYQKVKYDLKRLNSKNLIPIEYMNKIIYALHPDVKMRKNN